MGGSGALTCMQQRGLQDTMLTSDPQITFWRSVFRRYTAFAIDVQDTTFSGQVGAGRQVSLIVPKGADLLHKAYLVMRFPAIAPNYDNGSTAVHWTPELGYYAVQEAQLQVGGTMICQVWGDLMSALYELNNTPGHNATELVGRYYTQSALVQRAKYEQVLYVELPFPFAHSPGLAFPLISAQYVDLKIVVNFAPMNRLWVSLGNPAAVPIVIDACRPVNDNDLQAITQLFYVYLDGPERVRFAQSMSEQLIVQYQTTGMLAFQTSGAAQTIQKFQLTYSHPVSAVFGHFLSSVAEQNKIYTQWANPLTGQHYLAAGNMKINQNSLYNQSKGPNFFMLVNTKPFNRTPEKAVYVFSNWSLEPSKSIPTGTANFSRFDTAFIEVTLAATANAANLKSNLVTGENLNTISFVSYATNFNVLKFISGLCGVAYA